MPIAIAAVTVALTTLVAISTVVAVAGGLLQGCLHPVRRPQ
jgi:hypothetical protein